MTSRQLALVIVLVGGCGDQREHGAQEKAPGAPLPAPTKSLPETDVTRGKEATANGDHAAAAALFTKACDAKLAGGCGHLALLHRRGEGVKEDHALATSMATKACDAGDAFGCYALGLILDSLPREDGTSRPAEESIVLYEKACTGGSTEGCITLGDLYRTGYKNVPADPAKRAAWLKRACDLGDRRSCDPR